MRIDADLLPILRSLYLPLAAWVDRRYRAHGATLVVGLCGAQGSGKSTLAALLKEVLHVGFERSVATLSIDDLYKTKEERERLAASVHPLFVTRGVPFTHDVTLGMQTINRLKVQKPGESIMIPAFDKALDTRKAPSRWPSFAGRADIILFEGWCVGARPQTDSELAEPVNELEREEDARGLWRRRVNEALAGEYQALFELLDVLTMLEVQDMARVFEWRRLQEHKLADEAALAGADPSRMSIMSDLEVDRFIMHYERLTRHILSEMPQRADIVLSLDETHNAARICLNQPLG